jgi:signal recognition particle subunit SRP54
MGDVLSLIERAQETIDQEEALKAQAKLQQGKFDLEDFLSAMRQLKRMGSLRSIMEMMPGFNKLTDLEGMDEALEGDSLKRVEAIILSMTFEERRNPDIINGSRRKRIAGGSGSTPQEINQLLEQFGQMRTMMRQVSSGKGPWAKMAKQYAKGGGMPGMPGMPEGVSMPAIPSTPGRSGGGKKAGKAARKEKRKQRAKSRR